MTTLAEKSKKGTPAASHAPWPLVSLGDVVDSMKNGIYRPSSCYADDGLACLRMYNIDGGSIVWRDIKRMKLSESEIRDYELLPGDLLVNRVNSRELVGKTAVIPDGLERCIFESKNIRVRVKRDLVEPKFAGFALLSSGRNHFDQNAQQVVGMASISQPQVASFKLPLPPLPEQRRIVAEIEQQFTRLDAGVAALRRVQANLKRYRAAVLKAACEGLLVPTEAELQSGSGVPPLGSQKKRQDATSTFETGEQLLARILTERRKNWSGRGKYKEPEAPNKTNVYPLPIGWRWTNIGQVAEVGTGATPNRGRREYYTGGEIPWVTSGCVNNPRVDKADQFVTSVALDQCNLTVYPPGTLILAMYGEGKTRGMAAELGLAATTNQALAAIQTPEAIRGFIKVVLWKTYEDIRKSASGGVQPNLNLSLVRAIPVPLPCLAEQTRIVAEVERRLSVVDELESVVTANLQRATRLRQSILQTAFSDKT
jgi:type I restriction enzyme S subunit